MLACNLYKNKDQKENKILCRGIKKTAKRHAQAKIKNK